MGRDRGSKESKSRKKHKHSRSSSSPASSLDSSRVLKYAALGKTRKLRSLLAGVHDAAGLLAAARDRGGGTALHAVGCAVAASDSRQSGSSSVCC